MSVKRSTRAPRTAHAGTPSRQALVHELQVHQVELEQQNEELRLAQDDLESARDRFIDLYDFAPVGYLTLQPDGQIVEANLTAAAELGVDREALLGDSFARFVAAPDGQAWERLLAAVIKSGNRRSTELLMQRQDGRRFEAMLACLRAQGPGTSPQMRVTLTDVSVRKLAETNYRIAINGNIAHELDRRGLAYKLHEDLGQRLTALKLRLGLMARRKDSAAMRSLTGSMATEIDQVLAVVRQMSTGMHPLILDHLGLNAALDWLARDVATRLDLTVEPHLADHDPMLDGFSAIAVYRVAETALQHLAVHVHGGVSLELLHSAEGVTVQFQGEPGHLRSGARRGTLVDISQAMKDQVHLLGGRIEVDDAAPGRWRIAIALPFSCTDRH